MLWRLHYRQEQLILTPVFDNAEPNWPYPLLLSSRPVLAGNCIITPPSQVAVISGPGQSRMVIGEW